MKPYSLDLRERIVKAAKTGESHTRIAKRFSVCRTTVSNFVKLDATGSLAPQKKKTQKWRKHKFTPAIIDAMKTWLEEKNDMTLKQIQERLLAEFQIEVSLPSIWARLTAMKLTWKKK